MKRQRAIPTGDEMRDYAFASAYHQLRRHTHAYTLACWRDVLAQFGHPRSVLDVGCAEGVGVDWLVSQGIDAHGLDLAVRPGVPYLHYQDLREPCDLGRQFDLVTSWEVAEHLPASAADVLVETVVRHVAPEGRIIFTASTSGGDWHPNPQQSDYWLNKFAAHGFVGKRQQSSDLRRRWKVSSPSAKWYWEDAHVLRACDA